LLLSIELLSAVGFVGYGLADALYDFGVRDTQLAITVNDQGKRKV
jgi:hypothetical protein